MQKKSVDLDVKRYRQNLWSLGGFLISIIGVWASSYFYLFVTSQGPLEISSKAVQYKMASEGGFWMLGLHGTIILVIWKHHLLYLKAHPRCKKKKSLKNLVMYVELNTS